MQKRSSRRSYRLPDDEGGREMMLCSRCGELKDDHWFPREYSSWRVLCNRCIESPAGDFPIRQTKEHKRNDHDHRRE
ncbi:protein NinD [Edwardsiella tarda]|uniref:protein NinD n=1 Tax=Edwardsiella tarda TaxID=636 RepID=UPI00351C1781